LTEAAGPAWLPSSRRARVGLLVAAGALVRLAWWLFVTPDYVPISDANHFFGLAGFLADGEGFSLVFPQAELHATAFRPPLYPGLLGGVFAVFGTSIVAGRVVNLLIGLVLIVLVERLGTRLGGPAAGFVAAGLVAISPQLVANDLALLSEPLGLVLLVGLALALLDDRWVLAGALCGLVLLTRPSAQPFLLLVLAWVLWRAGWRPVLRVGLVGLAVVAPWVVRNIIQVDTPQLVTSNGFTLAAVYGPEAQERGAFVDPVYDPAYDDSRFRLLQFEEGEWDRELVAHGLEGLREHPTSVARVVKDNTLQWFELRPSANEVAERYDGRNLRLRPWTLPFFWVTTVLGVVGLARRWRDPGVVLVAGIGLFFTAISLVTVASPRLRAPFDLVCYVGVGLLVAEWSARRQPSDPDSDPDPASASASASASDSASASSSASA
jgi:4-amino-4-deoxy-L-arabinose transferase-like glycosyltransferase